MTTRKKVEISKVPVEVRWVLQYGKGAYKLEPSFEVEPNELCWEIYKTCGEVIRDRAAGPRLWKKYRADLIRKPDIRKWWAFKEFEKP